jgi:hypothetical protein
VRLFFAGYRGFNSSNDYERSVDCKYRQDAGAFDDEIVRIASVKALFDRETKKTSFQ